MVVQTLIEGIEQHSIETAPGEATRLRYRTGQLLAAVNSSAPPDELLKLSVLAMDAMKQQSGRVVEQMQNPLAELQEKVRVLTAAITAVSAGSSDNILRLRLIKRQMEAAGDVREVRSQKLRLSECLERILVEAERQRAEADRAGEQLNRSSQPVNASVPGEPDADRDPATGLPMRPEAEEVIALTCQGGAHAFIVVMVVNQIQTVSRTFGREFGDLMIQRFAAAVREQLPPIDQLFRWSGPTIVAQIRRKSLAEVRSAMEPVLQRKISVKAVGNDIEVPISFRWTSLPLMASPRLLFHKIDAFANFE